jgi:hypothetical protein
LPLPSSCDVLCVFAGDPCLRREEKTVTTKYTKDHERRKDTKANGENLGEHLGENHGEALGNWRVNLLPA